MTFFMHKSSHRKHKARGFSFQTYRNPFPIRDARFFFRLRRAQGSRLRFDLDPKQRLGLAAIEVINKTCSFSDLAAAFPIPSLLCREPGEREAQSGAESTLANAEFHFPSLLPTTPSRTPGRAQVGVGVFPKMLKGFSAFHPPPFGVFFC